MIKPTIFISHSPLDAAFVGRLKTMISDRTGCVLDIFVSSDGQSIPFGRNWVLRLEEALRECKAMIVLLTPASLESRWIFFEAGHAYAMKIRVIPIGALSVDMTKVPPPLGLLQGFNLKSEDGLNNIIGVVNELFGHNHKASFSAADYASLIAGTAAGHAGPLNEFVGVIDEIETTLHVPFVDLRRVLERYFTANATQYSVHDLAINTFGVRFRSFHDDQRETLVEIDPRMFSEALGILHSLQTPDGASLLGDQETAIRFNMAIRRIPRHHSMTAALHGTGVTIEKDGRFRLGNTIFSVDTRREMTIVGSEPIFKSMEVVLSIGTQECLPDETSIADILRILFDRCILGPD
ncbi:MAG: toll/interleukin-1 receptor domain-containing protein [Deltaproteobacteria bacterium]|nr:toll/interleukin-1 receptor domain-containing protein [Deltaproteobacteria bacterium]